MGRQSRSQLPPRGAVGSPAGPAGSVQSGTPVAGRTREAPLLYVLPALVVGVALGLATGGRLSNLSLQSLRWVALLVVGVLLQAVSGVGGSVAAPVLIASDAALVVFALANVRRPGMVLVAAGIALNLLPIAADGGMPVSPPAVVASGQASAARVARMHVSGKHHFRRPGDRFTELSDTIAIRPLRTVVSPGDIVLSVGMAAVIAGLLRRRDVGVAAGSGVVEVQA